MDRNVHGHIRHALRLQRLSDLATFVTAIGGVAATTLSAAFLGNALSNRSFGVALAAVGGVITLVSVVQAIWKPGERAKCHKAWSSKYAALENDCRLTMCGEGTKSLSQILDEVAIVSQHVDLVPERLWVRTQKKLGRKNDQ